MFATILRYARRCILLVLPFALCAPGEAQHFLQPTVIPTGNWPVAVLSADVNGDGIADLVSVDAGATASASTTRIFLGNGYGGFTVSAVVATAGTAVAVGDLTGSGHAQLVWLTTDGRSTIDVHIAAINADGTAGTAQDVSVGLPAAGPNATQLGYLKIADLGPGVGVRLLAEDTANSNLFVLQATQPAQAGVRSPLTAHASSAGLLAYGAGPLTVAMLQQGSTTPDIIVNGQSGHGLSIFGANGAGQQPYTFGGISGIYSSVLADMDGDGQPDLIAEGPDGSISIYHGNGNGTFQATPLAATGLNFALGGEGGTVIAAADLNGQGHADLVTATPAGVSVLFNDGHLHFTLGGIYNAGPGRTSFTVAPLHGLPVPDIAVDSPEGIAVLFNKGNGTFQTSRSFPTGQPSYDVQLGKFSASGNLDAVVATGVPQIQWLQGDGAGNFALNTQASPRGANQSNSSRSQWPHLVQGDFDGDGKLDVAITLDGRFAPQTGDGLTVHFGNGDGTFSAPVQQAMTAGSSHFGASAAGNFAGTAATDLVNIDTAFYAAYLGGVGTRTGVMPRSVLYNDTNDDTTTLNAMDLDSFNLVASGYLNAGPHSGHQDVILQDDNRLLVFGNNGDATFTLLNVFNGPTGVTQADGITGMLGNTGLFAGAMVFADLDGDGLGDLIVTYNNLAADIAHPTGATPNQIAIFWGQGNGQFSAPQIITPTRNFYELTVADLNGDGVPDLLLSDGYMLGVMPNLGGHNFGAEQHYLAGMGINISRVADLNSDGANDVVVANGGPVLANPAANKGQLAAADLVNTGAVTVLLNSVIAHVVTGSVTASPEPTPYGTAFTLTATVVPPASGAQPTGTVNFSIDGASVGTGTLTGGAATYMVNAPTYPKGVHTLTAVYTGDVNYGTATFTGSHTVTGLRSATVFTNSTPVIYYGQVADGNGTVTALDSAAGADLYAYDATHPQPTITFYDGTTSICMLPLLATPGTCPASAGAGFSVGMHTVTAVYSGNEYYDGSTSPDTTTQVLPDDTSGAVVSSLNPSTFGQAVTLAATFTALYATPTGTVKFFDGATQIGSASLNASGQASLLISTLAVGSHNVTAVLLASTDFNASTTQVLVQVVNAAAINNNTAVLLSSSANPSTFGQSVTFTAAVMTTGGVITIPSGNLTFSIDGQNVSTTALNPAGTAQFVTSTLAVGTHNVLASYAGLLVPGVVFAPSVSSTLSQVVNNAGVNAFTLTVTPAAPSIPIGSSISGTATVTENASMQSPVALACAGLPAEATCTFDAPTLPAGGGTTRITIAVSAPHDCDNNTPYFIGHSGASTWMEGLGVVLLMGLVRRKRRVLQGVVLLAALMIAPLLSGCGGHCTDLGVRPGTYNFSVTATTISGPTQSASQTLQMLAHI